MRWFYPTAFVTVLVLVLSPMAFLGGELKEQHPPGVLSWNTYSSDVKSLDPATCGDVTSAGIQGFVYEGLYTYHYLKRPFEVVPQLAQGMPEISPDGLVYTIHLRRDAHYHRSACFGRDTSGTGTWATRQVSARDVVLACKRVADYHINTGLAWAFLADRIAGLDDFRERTKHYAAGDFSRYDQPVAGLAGRDDSTVVITLTAPFPQFIYVLAMSVYAPIPQEVVDYWLTTADDGKGGRRPLALHERNPEIMEPAAVVGTGAYLLDTFKRKWKIVMVRNPEFRPDFYPCEGEAGDSAAGLLADCGKRVPFTDIFLFRYVEEEYANWMLFLSRQRDVAGIPREAFEKVVTPGKELTDAWKKRHIDLRIDVDPAVYWIVFNMEDSLLGASKALRQAMCLCYDVESEIEVLYNGRGRRAVNVTPSGFRGHDEAGPGPYARYDTAAARAKLADAKKELAARGLLVNGEIPEIRFDLSDGAAAMRLAEFAKQQFAQIGLRVKPIFNDWPTLQRKVNNKQSQMYTMGWHADYPDAENFLQLYYSGNIDKGTNNANYRNREFDSLYETVRVMMDSPERTALYVRMIHILSEDCPVLLLSEPVGFTLFYPWAKNNKHHPIGYGFGKYLNVDTRLRASMGGRE